MRSRSVRSNDQRATNPTNIFSTVVYEHDDCFDTRSLSISRDKNESLVAGNTRNKDNIDKERKYKCFYVQPIKIYTYMIDKQICCRFAQQ